MDMLLTPERSEQSELEHESSSLKHDVAFFTEDRAATLLTRMVRFSHSRSYSTSEIQIRDICKQYVGNASKNLLSCFLLKQKRTKSPSEGKVKQIWQDQGNLQGFESPSLHFHSIKSLFCMQPGKWRLRQPRWMQMQRAHMLMLFRAIQAVKFRGTTTDSPKLPLSCIPATYKVRLSNCKLPTFLNLERHRRRSAMIRS